MNGDHLSACDGAVRARAGAAWRIAQSQVRETAERLYEELRAAGIDVLLDDRDERPGVMLSDIELIGIPHRLVVGDRGLKPDPSNTRRGATRRPHPFPCTMPLI